jgi:hypothetical protein
MEDKLIKEKLYTTNKMRPFATQIKSYSEDPVSTNIYNKLASEGFESFFYYLDWLGLAYDPEILILPSTNHFIYNADDLKETRIVANLRQLNYIKQIKEYLQTLYKAIPNKFYFVGFFTEKSNPMSLWFDGGDSKSPSFDMAGKNKVTSPVEPFINKVYDILGIRINKYHSNKSAKILLENAGLKVLDMTELDGLTYFCAQKVVAEKE